ncbi:MAG: serine hydrolase [Bacteroidales bacterium]|nr:serine hydrolase [Bacteroidales bacterium]
MKSILFKTSAIWIISFVILLYQEGSAQQNTTNKELKELASFYETARLDWKVPGLAVAIVKDGEMIFAEGFGVRNIETNEPVDSKTMFPIASNTKAFTAAALAILVDEGKIDWDDKVMEYLPGFKLYDPYVSENLTIRDLLTHRSGLATFSGDLLWYGSNYSRGEVMRRARFLKPVYGFRENFGYSNIMYIAAGEIIPVITGKSWDNFVKEKFFIPLQMQHSITSTNDLPKFDNVASPHTDYQEKVIPVEYLNWDNVAPAGAIISNVEDVSQWLKLQLNRGIWNNDTIFTPQRSKEMWSQNTVLNISGFSEQTWPSTFFKSYGLGWSLSNYLGHKIVAHSGGYDGMISYTCMVPDQNLGFVILTNKNSSLYYPLMYKTLDVFLNGGNTDWSKFILDLMENQKAQDAKEKEESLKNQIKNTNPSLALETYTGTFGGELYGDASVELENGELLVQFVPSPKFRGTLRHLHFDTFELTFTEFPSLPPGTCNFILDADGRVSEMKIDVPNPDFDFTELEFKKQK